MNIFDGVDEARMAVAKRIEQDISYGRFLTLTLEANRTESVHQRHDRPGSSLFCGNMMILDCQKLCTE